MRMEDHRDAMPTFASPSTVSANLTAAQLAFVRTTSATTTNVLVTFPAKLTLQEDAPMESANAKVDSALKKNAPSTPTVPMVVFATTTPKRTQHSHASRHMMTVHRPADHTLSVRLSTSATIRNASQSSAEPTVIALARMARTRGDVTTRTLAMTSRTLATLLDATSTRSVVPRVSASITTVKLLIAEQMLTAPATLFATDQTRKTQPRTNAKLSTASVTRPAWAIQTQNVRLASVFASKTLAL